MKIGLDFHLTVEAHPALFLSMVHGFEADGHSWGIVTSMTDEKEQQLNFLASHGFPPPDFFVAKPPQYKAMPNVLWKSNAMAAIGLNYLIDDLDTGRPAIYDKATEVRARGKLARGRRAS